MRGAKTIRNGLAVTAAALFIGAAFPPRGQDDPEAKYWVWVANESSDLVSLVLFGPDGLGLERDIEVGIMPADLDGAHGLSVSPDRRHLYLSLAHGTPYGKLWKIDMTTGELADSTTLGRFPATIGITPDASMAFVVNFNLHGDPEPSSVSAVFLPAMYEMARIDTCVKPHGSRVNHAGTRNYTVCVGDDQLVEISVERLRVRRRMVLTPGREAALTASGAPRNPQQAARAASEPEPTAACGPTWVMASHDDRHIYVACNKHDQVLEIDATTFDVTRRFTSGRGPYNLAATSDGRLLLATNKGGQSVSVFELSSGRELARIETTRPLTHGITISPDDRYAFVSNEAIGATRGTVDVLDLRTLERIATTEVHHQPGGIDFWKMESPGS